MKKVLITGVMGFIGFHLCNRLLNEGIEVIGVDMTDRTHKNKIYEQKMMLMGRNSNFTLFEDGVHNLPLLAILEDVDVVYHLAATTGADHCWPDLQCTIENNVKMTKRLVNSCKANTRVIFTSTIEVYGERVGVITEKTPTNPISPYGLTKLAGEAILFKEKRDDIDVNILRLPTIYGPWQREDMAFHKMLLNKSLNQEVKIEKDRSTIDVLYIDDVVEALLHAGKTDYTNEIYNLSTGREREWYRAIAHIREELDRGWKDPLLKAYVCDQKAKQHLNFKSKTTIENGLRQQEEHIKKWKKIYS